MPQKPAASRARASRSSSTTADVSDDRIASATAATCDEIQDAIEDERSRLMTAEALLHCIVIALNDHDGDAAHGPDYHTLVALARDLVRRSIDALDSMRLRPALPNRRAQEGLAVRECTATYVH